MKKFLKYFTEIDIGKLENKINNEKDINKLKILLANEATAIVHGHKASKESEETAKETFEKGGLGKNIPERKVNKKILLQGINIIDLFFQNGLVQSKSECRRILKNNGIKINDEVISDDNKIINMDNVSSKKIIKLSVGKKIHLKVTVV